MMGIGRCVFNRVSFYNVNSLYNKVVKINFIFRLVIEVFLMCFFIIGIFFCMIFVNLNLLIK